LPVLAREPVPTHLAGAPSLRLLPVPPCEPPYDDELAQEVPAVVVARPAGPTVGPLRSLPPLRLVPAVEDDPHHDEDEDGPDSEPGTVRTPLGALPPVRPSAQALVQGLLEVVAGVRPVSQLRRATSPELFDALETQLHARPRPTGSRPPTGAVRSLHVQARPEGVAEVCATVTRAGRAAALALRLEGVDGRWCCTELAGL